MIGTRVCVATIAVALACTGRGEAVDRRLGSDVAKPVAAGTAWSADARGALARDLDAMLDAAPTLRGAHVGLLAIDTRSSDVLYARKPDDAFQPASTFKLLTGSVALAKLTPSFRFRTQAALDATDTMLYIKGGGDPLLSDADIEALAQSVRASGVVDLAGVRIDASDFESAPYPPGWSWDDFVYDYAPALSAAGVEENVVHLTVVPGARAGDAVDVSGAPSRFAHFRSAPQPSCPFTRGVVVSVEATTAPRGAANTLDLRRSTGGCIEIIGSVPVGSPAQTLDAAVPSPVWYLRTLTENALAWAGVGARSLSDATASPEASDGAVLTPPRARVLWTHDGEPLSDLLADLWWPSDNLIAELLLKAVARQAHGVPGTTAGGADVERTWLAGIGVDPATLTIADGSGLSTYDRITPRALAAILQADWNGPDRDMVLDDLPLAGVRGTLEHSFQGSLAERRTFAKTGSVNHTRALAGYLATLHHGAVTFAWLVDDWMGSSPDLDALRARVLSRIIGD